MSPLILLLAFLAPVLLFQVYGSFRSFNPFNPAASGFVWFENYAEVFGDGRFWWSIARSLIFAGSSTFLSFLIGFGLALLMKEKFAGRGIFYMLFIIPMLMVPVVIGYTFEMLLVSKGPLNTILSYLWPGEVMVTWLAQEVPASLSLIFIEVWNWTPFVFIILLAGLTGVSKEPIEAAQVMGASRFRIFREIEMPLLRPVIILVLILRFLEALAEFPKNQALTQGGPGTATETVPVLLYLTSWEYNDLGKGFAMSYALLVMVVAIVYVAIRVLMKEKRALDEIYAQ
ncbi:MAG: carbohydrate ABC transporter permease [Nitrospinota bacterium]